MYGLEEAAAHGITTMGDGQMYWKRGWYDVWLEAEQTRFSCSRVITPLGLPINGNALSIRSV